VYLEGIRYGNLETLKSIAAFDVAELRLLGAGGVTLPGNLSGVILVRLRR
jgi:hypothetical protein